MEIAKWFESDTGNRSSAIVQALSGEGDSRPKRF